MFAMTLFPMSAAGVHPIRRTKWWLIWALLIAATIALLYLGKETIPWAFKYPRAWVLPLKFWISDCMKWLIHTADLGPFTFKELIRSISWGIEQPYILAKSLLSTGFLSGVGSYAEQIFPRIPWLAVVAVAVLFGRFAKDWKLALLVGVCFGYLVVFGQWDSAMVTLSSIVIAVPFGIAGGLALGIAGYRSSRVEKMLTPVLDLMQTVPVFAYLVPILILFGFGPVAAMIATIIYAMPPMVRVTMLALRSIPAEIVEAGAIMGCTKRQLLWKVLLPAARHSLMVGVNQVVMLSLNMVIIASMIGAGGLGHAVLTALKRLKIGEGIEAGLAITLLAIALDRLSQAWAQWSPPEHNAGSRSVIQRYAGALLILVIIVATWLLGMVFPAVNTYPKEWEISMGTFWGDVVRYINVNYFDVLDGIKNFLLLHLMIPCKRFLLSLPWPAVVAMIGLLGWQLGGRRLALLTSSLALFVVVVGLWPKAMVTIYLCGLSVVIACLIGIPIGMMAARNERLHRVAGVLVDTLQTLPSFVYLMPVVMLFRVGDFAAMLAVIAYAIAPVIRYTDHGIRKVSPDILEAATQAGATKRQRLWKVQMPIALPHIMLGVNQTIMMALSMLVITALVGTRELGQEVYIALTKADTGRGIVAGICVAFIAIIADRLINAWAGDRKRELGLV